MFNNASGFIFDCDGTLLDTLHAWELAEAELFAEAGTLSVEQEDEIHAAPIAEAARLLHENYGVKDSTQAVLDHLDDHLLPFYGEASVPLPGAVELVKALHKAQIPMVVLSSSPCRYLEAGLQRAGVLECFVELVSTEDLNISKQDPRIYQYAMRVLDSSPSTTWGVDDAPYALQVMKDCGMNTIGVGNGCSPERAAKLEEISTIFVDSLANLEH